MPYTQWLQFQLDDEREKEKDAALMEQIERNLEDFEDEFLKEYRQKRIEEMRRAMNNVYVNFTSFRLQPIVMNKNLYFLYVIFFILKDQY